VTGPRRAATGGGGPRNGADAEARLLFDRVSHDVRSPLNTILGFAELLRDGTAGQVNAEQREYLDDILTSARQLLCLLHDVLTLSRVEVMRFEPVDPGRLATAVREDLLALGPARRVTVALEVDVALEQVSTDPDRLGRVLHHYLSNALKFTPDGGHVTVRFVPAGPDAFRVEVEDDGIGIAPGDLPRLFTLARPPAPGTGRPRARTGLGLALTRRIVETLGGEVGVRSAPGGGSCFFAVLPRAEADARHT
jgi:signal transduction histidine kinase